MLGRTTCTREADVLAAVASTPPPDWLRAHLEACGRCRQALEVSAWMRRLAEPAGDTHRLPDAGLLWWKAQLVRRWQAERDAAAPIDAMHRAELVTGVGALAGVILWLGPRLVGSLPDSELTLDALRLTRWSVALDGLGQEFLAPLLVAMLGLAAVLTMTRWMSAE